MSRCEKVVTEYEDEEELVEFIRQLDGKINNFKNVKLQMAYGVYTIEDREMEQRQMEIQTQCLAVGDGIDYEKYENNPVLDEKVSLDTK